MTMIFIDGFDLYHTSQTGIGVVMVSSGYTTSNTNNCVPTFDTRLGLGMSCNMRDTRFYCGELNHVICGFALKYGANVFQFLYAFGYDNHLGSNGQHFSVCFNDLGQIILMRNNGGLGPVGLQGFGWVVVAMSEMNIIFPNTWHYMELDYLCGASGQCIVRIDGRTVLTYSGITNDAAQGSTVNQLVFATNLNQGNLYDDFYVLDTTGSDFNSFLGDVVVLGLLPNGDAGPNDMTKTGGGAGHYTAVDDVPTDEDSSYLFTDTIGDKEMFTLQDLPGIVVSVMAAQVNVRARKTNTGLANFTIKARVDTDEATSVAFTAADSYVQRSLFMPLNPAGDAWTIANVNDLEVGFQTSA